MGRRSNHLSCNSIHITQLAPLILVTTKSTGAASGLLQRPVLCLRPSVAWEYEPAYDVAPLAFALGLLGSNIPRLGWGFPLGRSCCTVWGRRARAVAPPSSSRYKIRRIRLYRVLHLFMLSPQALSSSRQVRYPPHVPPLQRNVVSVDCFSEPYPKLRAGNLDELVPLRPASGNSVIKDALLNSPQ